MGGRFYLATRKDRATEAATIVAGLKALGWERTFDWSNRQDDSIAGYCDTAVAELAAVRAADALLVLLPGGYGTHVEIGVALALDIPIIIHAPDRKALETPYPCVFHYHPSVKLLVSDTVDVKAVISLLSTVPCKKSQ
jgi:nucleoside 2-deoxyribosyltransferase